jgi:molybdate transport system permease protein
VAVLATVASVFFALPIVGLVARAPWGDAWAILTAPDTLTALRLSLWTSGWSTVLSLVFGVPLAWVLARSTVPGRAGLRALSTLSMVLPPVVAGVALFAALGRRGIVGQHLYDWFGIRLPFSTAGVVLAQTFVAMPFLVITVDAALRQAGTEAEEAARTLGGGPWYTFRRVTLPTIRPALVAGAVLAWARALGEFGATITFAGSFPGTTQTLPLAVYQALETDPGQAVLVALLMVAISFTVLVSLRHRWLGGGLAPGGTRA